MPFCHVNSLQNGELGCGLQGSEQLGPHWPIRYMGEEFGPGYTNPLLKVSNMFWGETKLKKAPNGITDVGCTKEGGGKPPVSHILLEEGCMLARNLYFGQSQSLLSHAKRTPLRQRKISILPFPSRAGGKCRAGD